MTTATMKVPRATFTTILMMIMTCPLNSMVAAFLAPTTKAFHRTTFTNSEVRRYASTITRSQEQDFVTNEGTINDGDADEVDIDFLFEEPEIPYESLDSMEKVWRYAKKPLLRIGSKGATHSHGNSLRQLLDDHTVVKVKCNLKKFGTLQVAFECLRDLAVENGASADIELIQMREGEKMILFGLPGTLKRLEEGSFPPAPVVLAPSEGDAE